MNAPGISIFQGAESIHLNSSINRLEEEEALEDQRRRDKELGNQLQNAFDDLIEEEDNTMDNSSNFPSNLTNGLQKTNGVLLDLSSGMKTENVDFKNRKIYEQFDRMKMSLESKDREIENISKIVHEERRKNDELQKRLALSEAERERSNMSKTQTHELLVESKAKCSELEDIISKLKAKIKSIEETNNDLVGQLERTQMLLADVQHKYNIVEKNANFLNDRNSDMWKKQIEDRHRGQIDMMQHQVDNLRTKLDDKENELKNMDTRYKELQRSREALLIDKSETINQLAKSLEQSQQQCQHLMSKQDFSQENVRLKRLVNELERQIETMQKTINTLKQRLESTTAELETMDSVLLECNVESSRRLSSKSNFTTNSQITTTDRANRLKQDLYRCMSSLKEKRDLIRKLQDELLMKTNEIKTLKEEENNALVKISTYKEENIRLENRLKIIKEEFEEYKNSSSQLNNTDKSLRKSLGNELDELQKENNRLQKELMQFKKKYENLHQTSEEINKNYEELKSKISDQDVEESRKMDSKLKNLIIDLEELRQEHDSLKLNYDIIVKQNESLKQRKTNDNVRLEMERYKFLLKDSQNECDRLKKSYVEICNAKDAVMIQFEQNKSRDFCQEYHEAKEKIANLERALQLTELKCSELTKLLETEKSNHEKDILEMREKVQKEKIENLKTMNTTNSCSKCIEHMVDLTKYEINCLKLNTQCTDYVKEIHELKSQLKENTELVAELKEKIVLKDDRDRLINELKLKAEQFEEYIKTQSSSGVSSPKSTESRDKSVNTSPELNNDKKQIELKVRDEMVKMFSIEIKNIEQRYKIKLAMLEDENTNIRKDVLQLSADLKQRQQEVLLLKHAILAEREKQNEILNQKDKEYQKIYEKQTDLMHKCRDELKLKEQKVVDLIKELEERNNQFELERKSMKAVMTQWEDQRKIVDEKNNDWRRIIDSMKTEHLKAIETLQNKFISAKKTALNYKRYAEDKENHMLQEYDRLKAEYESAVAKIETRVREKSENKTTKIKDLLEDVENDKLEEI